MKVGITCYPTYGGSGIVATELGLELAIAVTRSTSSPTPTRSGSIPDTPRIHYHEVEVSNYPLFHYPPYCLALASRMAEVAEHLRAWTCSTCITPSRTRSRRCWRSRCSRRAAAAVHHHAARHRYHAGGRRPLVLPDHAVLDRAVGRRHRDQRLPAARTSRSVRRHRTKSASSTISSTAKFTGRMRRNRGAAAYAPAGEKLLIHLSNFRPVKRALDCIRILAEVARACRRIC